METTQKKKQSRNLKKNQVFISWSGTNSKEVARGLKELLENRIFAGTDVKCFFSELDIESGSDWWKKIKKELQSCKLGIVCITKENLNSSWTYFEAGAMITRELHIIPLLINCDKKILSSTPLNHHHAVDFYDIAAFLRMLSNINHILFDNKNIDQLIETTGKEEYYNLKKELSVTLEKLRDLRTFNVQYVYPNTVDYIKRNTIFVGSPMSSIDSEEYKIQRDNIIEITKLLKEIGFSEVYCPIIDVETQDRFDGKVKAIRDNYPIMKSVESMLFIYPRSVASSSLAEMGYGIALTKNMVIFHQDELPYMLSEAGGSIANVKTYSFKSYNEIFSIIERNGMTLFEGGSDEL